MSAVTKTLTIRQVPRRLAEALDRQRRQTGESLNRTVLTLLARSLGVDGQGPRRNGLAKLAGTWTAGDQRQFDEAIAPLERVDDEMWG